MFSGSHACRLPGGGLVDRSRIVRFRFNGRPMSGYEGDTLCSALIANGVSIVARSLKYRRPRGFYGTGIEDPNSTLAVRDAYGFEPAIRAGQVRLCEGLEASTVRGWPSADFDILALLPQSAGAILAAGFYYKTFKRPAWRYFEPFIRRAAGYGRPRPELCESREVHHRYEVCDVLIAGGGPAGFAAARALSGSGLRTLLVDDQWRMGGSLNWEALTVDGMPGAAWVRAAARALSSEPEMTLLPSTTIAAAYSNNCFVLVEALADERGVYAERHWKVHARHVVLATGSIDRPLLFPGNDRPGIMLSNATRRLIGEFAVAPARQLAVYTNNDGGHLTALAAATAGLEVAAVVDTRAEATAAHASSLRRAGIRCLFDSVVVGTSGSRRLARVAVRTNDGHLHRIHCDGLAVSGGSVPAIQLACHREGVRPVYDEQTGTLVADRPPRGWRIVGGARGVPGAAAAFAEGHEAGRAIAIAEHAPPGAAPVPAIEGLSSGIAAARPLPHPDAWSRVWVDLHNDVKASDVDLAVRENYVSVEHLKRYTTLGMGTDQGRTSNLNGGELLAALTGRTTHEAGTTTFRPPVAGMRLAAIAGGRSGELFRPRRLLPAHRIHCAQSAVFEDFGWQRPDWYMSNGADRESAVAVEMAAVRNRVGVFDASSLGKVEITGPDAPAFLDRCYVSALSTLRPGRIRYTLMLKDDGVIFDDGVVARLGANYFLASPTSGNAEAVVDWLERWRQTEWPWMKVAITPVTSNWTSIAIAGPRARRLLSCLEPDFDVSNPSFPHMSFHAGRIAGVEVRVARVSFTGELQYEISVAARYAESLLALLLEAGGELAPLPVGMEAWLRLRLEKGYLHVGTDTNGRTTPLDIGMQQPVSRRTGDFIGKRSLELPYARAPEREQLVGLIATTGLLPVGGRVIAPGYDRPPCPTQGAVTSAGFSPSLGASIGLALIERGRARTDEVVRIYADGNVNTARIAELPFLDPGNERLKA